MWQNCSGRSRAKTYRASASSLVGLAKGATTTGEWPSKAYSISSPASKGSRCLGHLMPALVVDLSHQGRPEPRLQLLEPLGGDRTGPNQPPMEVDKDPPRTRVESRPPPARVESLLPPSQGGKSSTPRQSSKPASTSGGGKPATSGGPVNPPPGRGGVGDSTLDNWYQMTMSGAEGGISEPQGPPYPIGMVQARRKAIAQIYDWVDGKDPPSHNIASEALWAYYTRVDPQTLNTWACQILCMISEYHMACITRGPPVTSPILPGELEDRLPPLTDYASPEDRSGTTDIRVRDHRARTL